MFSERFNWEKKSNSSKFIRVVWGIKYKKERVYKALKGLEKSTIDYFIVFEKMRPLIKSMTVDGERINGLTKFVTNRGIKQKKEWS